MIVEDRAKKEKNKRLGSNHAVDLGEDEFFFGAWDRFVLFCFCIISFSPSFDLFVRSGLPVLIDLIVGDEMARLM